MKKVILILASAFMLTSCIYEDYNHYSPPRSRPPYNNNHGRPSRPPAPSRPSGPSRPSTPSRPSGPSRPSKPGNPSRPGNPNGGPGGHGRPNGRH